MPHIQTIVQTLERKLKIINMPKTAKKRVSGGKHDHGPSVALVVNNGDAATKCVPVPFYDDFNILNPNTDPRREK